MFLLSKSAVQWCVRFCIRYSRTLSQHNKNEEHSKEHSSFLVRRKGHSCEPSSQLISFADYGFATVTGFTLFAKNSPPDYFLNAKTLSGFESLQPEIIKIAKQINIYFAILVRRKGLEPPTYWFVASHSIQLSYRRIPQAVFACEQYYNTFLLKMQVFFT